MSDTATGERAVLRETLARHRALMRTTVEGVGERDARRRTTVSELTLGGLLKHVVHVEEVWTDFVRTGEVRGFDGLDGSTGSHGSDDGVPGRPDLVLRDGETVAELLDRWERVADRTDALVATCDLDASHPLPDWPWNPPGARWSARQALANIVGETAQHSGHADIIRESLDGSRTMG